MKNTNRLENVTGPSGSIDYLYDNNGNPTTIGDWTLVYNQNNRLIRVEETANPVPPIGKYTYNGLGQRVIKTVAGVDTIFHYDFDGNIIAESDSSAIFSYEYLYVSQARLAMVDVASGDIYYFLNNYLGTPVMMTDDTNKIVWEADYKPFGEAEVNPNSEVVNNFRFAGQYYDQETGFHYNWHRYYDPKSGRYLRPDPIGISGGVNLYIYVNNNPVNFRDLSGLSYLIFDRNANTLTLFNADDEFIGIFSAANNPCRGYEPWPTGIYSWNEYYVWPDGTELFGYKPHPESGPNDSFGSYGIFMFDTRYTDPQRIGLGVHSGRANDGGYRHCTWGCIRTTDEAMEIIKTVHFGFGGLNSDPLSYIVVLQNNEFDF